MNAPRTRYRLAALAIALLGVIEAGEIVSRLLPSAIGTCAIDVFGFQLPSSGTDCYLPIGESVLVVIAHFVLATAVALWPTTVAPPAALLVAVLAASSITTVLREDDPLTLPTLLLGLRAAIPFLVFVPTGARAHRGARLAWFLLLVAAAGLAAFDQAFSGFFRVAPPMPQVAFVLIGFAIAAAGWLSGRLEAGRGGVEPGPAAADPVAEA